VVLCTLILQGMTLRPLMHRLRLTDDGSVERERSTSPRRTARAALRALENQQTPSAELLRSEYQARLRAGESKEPIETLEAADESLAGLQQRAVQAQREALTDLARGRVIGDDALHVVEEEIDLLDLTPIPACGPLFEREPTSLALDGLAFLDVDALIFPAREARSSFSIFIASTATQPLTGDDSSSTFTRCFTTLPHGATSPATDRWRAARELHLVAELSCAVEELHRHRLPHLDQEVASLCPGSTVDRDARRRGAATSSPGRRGGRRRCARRRR
jgi:hypothetical protein